MSDWSGSRYEGPKDNGWYQGKGVFYFPNGVKYEGEFVKGEFHGEGTLIYPNGGRYVAKWERGKMMEGQYFFHDDLKYDFDKWDYCTTTDRRFYTEIKKGNRRLSEGMRPEGQTLKVNSMSGPKPIPKGTYDVGEGYFDPVKGIICDYKGDFRRDLQQGEDNWITKNCRYNPRTYKEESELIGGGNDQIIKKMIQINEEKEAEEAKE